MKYIINSNIEFDTTEYVLKSLNESNLLIKLSNSAGRILEELIKHQNTELPVTREHLFSVVWETHGLNPSNGNLNQQIRLIRKAFSNLNLDSSSIITIPKRGLKLNNRLKIKNVEDNSIKSHISSNNHIIDQNQLSNNSMLLSFKTYIKYIITFTTISSIIFSISFLYLYNKSNHIKLYCCKEINTCNICAAPVKSEFDNSDQYVSPIETI